MKKIIIIFFSLLLLTVLSTVIFLSTKGYETDRFNSVNKSKVKKSNNNLSVDFDKISKKKKLV